MTKPLRCPWVGENKPFYEHYHDTEWGVPVHNDNLHFEMLVLEGAQAGLSWETILKKREGYRKLFKDFIPSEVAQLSDESLEEILKDPAIVRNRLKVYSVRRNAIVFLKIQKEFGSFDHYVWAFVHGKPKINAWNKFENMPPKTKESDALSKDLKKRGMNFVGSTIIYAYMQAIGMVNDHLVSCFRHKECGK
jgi:DNA-3-methyladenine glycosylase I